MASSFEQLPSELLLHILKYTPRPSDRRSFCLTSRTFYQFALPLLYHTITIGGDLGSELTPDVKGSLIQIGHPGLVHIRRLEITAPDGRRGPDNCKVEARFVKQLLLILPRDGLRHIVCPNVRIDETAIYSLLAQQQKLKTLKIGPVMCDFARLLETSTLSWSNLTSLEVPEAVGAEDIEACRMIIKQAPHLSDLTIRCASSMTSSTEKRSQGIDAEELYDFLDDTLSANGPTKLKLAKLCLQDIEIEEPFVSRLEISHLRSVCIRECTGGDVLLMAITAAGTNGECALQELIYDAIPEEPFFYEELAQLLRSFTGLKKLHLARDVSEDSNSRFDFGCLDGHKGTLESIYFGCSHVDAPDAELLLGLDLTFFTAFPKLRYLAVPMPATTIPFSKTEHLKTYVDNFQSLMALPELQALRIINYPRAAEGAFAVNVENIETRDKVSAKAFMSDLDDFVAKQLGPHLGGIKVLCFGSGQPGGQAVFDGVREFRIPSAYYAAEKRMSLYGSTFTSASRISLKDASWMEPDLELENAERYSSME